jgi:hypothetical protein
MADKLDLTLIWKADYVTPRKPVLLDIGSAQYLSIEGRGEPGGAEFTNKIGALYAMAYTIKMTRKFDGRQDYPVFKLEAQWWGEDGSGDFARVPKSQWCWRLMIRTPECVLAPELAAAREVLLKRKKADGTEDVRLHVFTEGQCIQMLHVGPYENEAETSRLMTEWAQAQGLEFCGVHHEIYISDPRRVPPEKLKTILRHPVRGMAQYTHKKCVC